MNITSRWSCAALATCLAISLAVARAPGAAATVDAARRATVALSTRTVALDGHVRLSVSGFASGEFVSVAISQRPGALATLHLHVNGWLTGADLAIPATFQSGGATMALSPGGHTLTVTGLHSGRSAHLMLTLVPGLRSSSLHIPLGGSVVLSGAGFATTEPVAVSISQMPGVAVTLTADVNGLVQPTRVVIPPTFGSGATSAALSPGVHTLTLTGSVSGRTAHLSVTLLTALNLSSTGLALGGQVRLSGAGFGSSEPVIVSLSQDPNALAALRADVNGLVPLSGLTIPYTFTVGASTLALSPGLHTLTIRGAVTARAVSVAVTLRPALNLSTTTIPLGSVVTLSAAGFEHTEVVTVSLSQEDAPLATLMADANGIIAPTQMPISATFAQTATMLALSPGLHTLTMTGAASGRRITMVVTLLPSAQLSATMAHPGDHLTLSGAGFQAAEPVTVSLDGAVQPLASLISTANGLVSATPIALPTTLLPGPHHLLLTGTLSGRQARVDLTVTAPQ